MNLLHDNNGRCMPQMLCVVHYQIKYDYKGSSVCTPGYLAADTAESEANNQFSLP